MHGRRSFHEVCFVMYTDDGVANKRQGVACAFHGETHTMGGYPRTSETCKLAQNSILNYTLIFLVIHRSQVIVQQSLQFQIDR